MLRGNQLEECLIAEINFAAARKAQMPYLEANLDRKLWE
jgi:hypothetical protein